MPDDAEHPFAALQVDAGHAGFACARRGGGGVAERDVLSDEALGLPVGDAFGELQAQQARVVGLVREELAEADSLEDALPARRHRDAGRAGELGEVAVGHFDRDADVGEDLSHAGDGRERLQRGIVQRDARPGLPRRVQGAANAVGRIPAATPALAAGARRRRHGDRVEHARPEQVAEHLVLHRHAERHHADERRDADRDAERRERRAELRLAQVPQREVQRVGQPHAAASASTLPSESVIVRFT